MVAVTHSLGPMSISRGALIASFAVALTAVTELGDDKTARAGSCVDRLGAPDDVGVAIDPTTGGWCMDGSIINAGSPAAGLAMNVRTANAIVDDSNPATADRWDYPGGIADGRWDDGSGGSGAERNTSEFVAALPSWSDHGLDLVTVGLQGANPRFECVDQTGTGRRVFSQYDDSTDHLLPAAKDRLRRVIAAAWEARVIVSVQLFYQNESDAEPDTDAEILATIDNVTDWVEELSTTPQGPSAPDGYQNVVIEIANEVTSAETYGSTTALDPIALVDRVVQIHQAWPGAFVTVNLGTSERSGKLTAEENDALHAELDWVSLHANVISGTTLASRIERARSDPQLLGKPVVVTEDRWGRIETGDAPVLAPYDDGYDVNPNLMAAVSAGAGWGYYEQGCEAGEGDGIEPYADDGVSPPAGNHYANGYQSLPIHWSATAGEGAKHDFFTDVADVTSSDPAPSPSPTVSPSPSPTVSPSPSPTVSPPPTGTSVRPLAAFHTGANRTSYSFPVPQRSANEVVLVIVGSTASTKNSRVPIPSGFGSSFSVLTPATFSPATKFVSRVDSFIASGGATSGGTLTVAFAATQADVHVVVLGVRNDAAPVTIGNVASASGSGTLGSLTIDGDPTSRTIVTVLHAAQEGSQPEPGFAELADTQHGSRSSGMATAWSTDAFDATPSYSWGTPSPWGGIALEVGAA